MGWIVGKPIKVERNGRTVPLKPGDPVPEAATFRNRKAWIKSGHIRWQEDPTPRPTGRKSKPKDTAAETPAEPVAETPAEPKKTEPEVKPPKKAAPKKKPAAKKSTSKSPSKKKAKKKPASKKKAKKKKG